MATAVHDRRLTRRFELMDADGDGYIEREDYEALARRLVQGFAESSTSPKGRAVVDTYLRFWEEFVSTMDADGDGRVSRDEFVNAIKGQVIDGDAFDRVYPAHVRAVVELADTNNDGTLDRSEYVRLMSLYGVNEHEASGSFEHVDADHDGYLTVDEMIAHTRSFYLNANPDSSGRDLFGRV